VTAFSGMGALGAGRGPTTSIATGMVTVTVVTIPVPAPRAGWSAALDAETRGAACRDSLTGHRESHGAVRLYRHTRAKRPHARSAQGGNAKKPEATLCFFGLGGLM
jgi:hypothetical protein